MTRILKASVLTALLAFSLNVEAKTHSVVIEGMQFNPAALTIAVGDTVEWVNKDILPHTATSKEWNSGVIQSEQTWKHTFKKAVLLEYACSLHPTMKAKLTAK